MSTLTTDYERLTLYSSAARAAYRRKKRMASAVTKTTEKTVEFYGCPVAEGVAVKAQSLVGSEIEASEGYTPEAGPNKGQYQAYEVEISFNTLVEKGFRNKTDEDKSAVSEPFTNLEAKTWNAAVTLAGSESDALDLFNRSYNMGRRQIVRQRMLAKLEGPQKAINKMVELLVSLGHDRAAAEAKAAELAIAE